MRQLEEKVVLEARENFELKCREQLAFMDKKRRSNFIVILVKPKSAENIGLVARSMKNTGFENLRLVMSSPLGPSSYRTAVHSRAVLDNAVFYPTVEEATADCELVFSTSSKTRKNSDSLSLEETANKILCFPPSTRIGFLFGNERTGLTSREMRCSNFRVTLPQASRQPSYNLASSVLLILFRMFTLSSKKEMIKREKPLAKKDQEECIQIVLEKLERKGFIHSTNKNHVSQMVYDLFGRLALTEKDRRLLLAIFGKV